MYIFLFQENFKDLLLSCIRFVILSVFLKNSHVYILRRLRINEFCAQSYNFVCRKNLSKFFPVSLPPSDGNAFITREISITDIGSIIGEVERLSCLER